MKIFIGFILAVLVFPFTTGASLIDKETKKMVEELNYKIEKLLQYGHTNHSEEMKAAQEQQEILQRLTTRVEALERRERAAAKDIEKAEVKPNPTVTQPAMVQASATPIQAAPISTSPASPVPVVPSPSPAVPITTSPIVQAAAPTEPAKVNLPETKPTAAATQVITLNPVAVPPVEAPKTPLPAAPAEVRKPPTPAPVPPKRPEPIKKPEAKAASPQGQGFSFDGVLPYLISGLSVLLMVFLFVRMKRSEQRIKTMLWRADMEALREDLARERKMNPKIHLTGEPGKIHLP